MTPAEQQVYAALEANTEAMAKLTDAMEAFIAARAWLIAAHSTDRWLRRFARGSHLRWQHLAMLASIGQIKNQPAGAEND